MTNRSNTCRYGFNLVEFYNAYERMLRFYKALLTQNISRNLMTRALLLNRHTDESSDFNEMPPLRCRNLRFDCYQQQSLALIEIACSRKQCEKLWTGDSSTWWFLWVFVSEDFMRNQGIDRLSALANILHHSLRRSSCPQFLQLYMLCW